MSFSDRTSGKIFRPVTRVRFGPANSKYRTTVRADNIISIATQKSMSSPCGTFEIVFNYDPNHHDGSGIDGQQARWSEILAPNDYVEIEFGRIGQTDLQIVMRGWIDNVTIAEQAGTQAPMLRITVNGRDYGKVWLVTKILNIAPGVRPQEYLYQYHIEYLLTNLPRLFHESLTKIAEPYVSYHQGINGFVKSFLQDTSTLDPDADSLTLQNVSLDYLMEVVYSMIAYYSAKPWIELFVQDYDSGPTFVCRWAPLRNSNNQQLTGLLASYPQAIPVHTVNPTDDITEVNLTRSDTDVFNWIRAYQTTQHSVEEQDTGWFTVTGQVPYIIGDSIDMYGLKKLMPGFPYIDNAAGEHKQQLKDAKDQVQEMVRRFTMWCADMYGHDYKLVNGSIRVKGLPQYRIGEELIVKDAHDVDTDRYYIEGVQHEFTALQSYRTTLSVTRGMPVNGFPDGGLANISPYKFPTSFPTGDEGVSQAFIDEMHSFVSGDIPGSSTSSGPR